MKAARLRFATLAILFAGMWASPACKSNEVNQTSNTENNFKTVVGPAGKTFDGPDGTKIRILPGALDEEVEIIIREATADEYPVTVNQEMPPRAFKPVGKVWAFEPHGLKFFADTTIWLPAPDGQYMVMKAQPGGPWQTNNGYPAEGGKIEFTTRSFSFYTLQSMAEWFGGDAAPPPDVSVIGDDAGSCDDCIRQCEMKCVGNPDPSCVDVCKMSVCDSLCRGSSDGGSSGDASTGSDSPPACIPMCPSDVTAATGVPCKPCPSAYPCPAKSGASCMCRNDGKLDCSGGGDASVSDTGADTTPGTPVCGDGLLGGTEECDDGNTTPGDGCSGLCRVEAGYTCPTPGAACVSSVCPTKTQTEGTGTFTGLAVQSAYAFYKENNLGSSYYSQLWLVMSDKPGVCTRSVSHQGAANGTTLRIRLEAQNTTTPTVFTNGTYATGSAYSVIGDTQTVNATCGPTGTRTTYGGGTVVITDTTGGRFKGTVNFPVGPGPAGNGTFDVPICLEDNPVGGGGDPMCCK